MLIEDLILILLSVCGPRLNTQSPGRGVLTAGWAAPAVCRDGALLMRKPLGEKREGCGDAEM